MYVLIINLVVFLPPNKALKKPILCGLHIWEYRCQAHFPSPDGLGTTRGGCGSRFVALETWSGGSLGAKTSYSDPKGKGRKEVGSKGPKAARGKKGEGEGGYHISFHTALPATRGPYLYDVRNV